MKKRIVYIAHPIGGDVAGNLADLRRILRHINLTMPDVVPLAPYYGDVVSLDDANPAERERGVENEMALLRSGIFTELWLTGPRISPGMRAERQLALDMRIPVLDKTGSELPRATVPVVYPTVAEKQKEEPERRQVNWPLTLLVWGLILAWVIYWVFIAK